MSNITQLITDHIALWTAADTGKKSGRGRASSSAGSVYGIKKLRELILELAVRGKLVPQDVNDEPASELLKRIQFEKAKLVAEGTIKKEKPYTAITDAESPFELPKSWKWARLGFIGNTQTGSTPSKSSPESFGADIPFIKPGDIYLNHVKYSNEGLSFYGAQQSGRTAQSGSILMVCIGTIGKCNLIERECSFNQQINSVTPYLFNSRYLLTVCRSIYFYSEAWSRSSSTTIAILNKGNWEEICVPIPPLSEQERIVAKVDELIALCDQLEAQHSNRRRPRTARQPPARHAHPIARRRRLQRQLATYRHAFRHPIHHRSQHRHAKTNPATASRHGQAGTARPQRRTRQRIAQAHTGGEG